MFYSSNQTLWIRLQNISSKDCYATTSFSLIVIAQVDILPDVVVCSSYTLPVLTKPGAKYLTANNSMEHNYLQGTVLPQQLPCMFIMEAGTAANTCSKLL
jgi:hypothetical protein